MTSPGSEPPGRVWHLLDDKVIDEAERTLAFEDEIARDIAAEEATTKEWELKYGEYETILARSSLMFYRSLHNSAVMGGPPLDLAPYHAQMLHLAREQLALSGIDLPQEVCPRCGGLGGYPYRLRIGLLTFGYPLMLALGLALGLLLRR